MGLLPDYSKQALRYDDTRAASPSALRVLRRALESAPGRRLLDIGGGTGNYAVALKRDGWEPAVVDRSRQMLARAAAKGLETVHADAQRLPFADQSMRAILMTNVLHHIPDARRFFAEASRCVRPGGRLLMIEPWLTSWSRFVYRHLHAEAFSPEAPDWSFASMGPLSGANTALPWIVFARDGSKFESEFPEFSIETIQPMLPFRYLVSGGVSMRNLVPGFTHSAWKAFERMLQSQMPRLGTFAFIALLRR